MERIWLVLIALLIAGGCMWAFLRQVATLRKKEVGKPLNELTLLFMVKNQQEIIEGLVRTVTAALEGPVELIFLDLGSDDQTGLILERLAVHFNNLRFMEAGSTPAAGRLDKLCRGKTVYCFKLTGRTDYNLVLQAIRSVLGKDSGHSRIFRNVVS